MTPAVSYVIENAIFIISAYDKPEWVEITLNNLRKLYGDKVIIKIMSRIPCDEYLKEDFIQIPDRGEPVYKPVSTRDKIRRRVGANKDISFVFNHGSDLLRELGKEWIITLHSDYIPINTKLAEMVYANQEYDAVLESDRRWEDGMHGSYFAYKKAIFSPEDRVDISTGVFETVFGKYIKKYNIKNLGERLSFAFTRIKSEEKWCFRGAYGVYPIGFIHTHDIEIARLWRI